MEAGIFLLHRKRRRQGKGTIGWGRQLTENQYVKSTMEMMTADIHVGTSTGTSVGSSLSFVIFVRK